MPDNPGFSTASSISLNITEQRYNCFLTDFRIVKSATVFLNTESNGFL